MNFETLEVSWSFGTFLIRVSPKFFFNNWKLVNFHGTQLLLISANEADKALSAALFTVWEAHSQFSPSFPLLLRPYWSANETILMKTQR